MTALAAIMSVMLSDFFDTMGTVFGLANEGDILEEDGSVPHFEAILLVDSLAAVAGGVANTSSNTSYIESASGVGDGARTAAGHRRLDLAQGAQRRRALRRRPGDPARRRRHAGLPCRDRHVRRVHHDALT